MSFIYAKFVPRTIALRLCFNEKVTNTRDSTPIKVLYIFPATSSRFLRNRRRLDDGAFIARFIGRDTGHDVGRRRFEFLGLDSNLFD